MRTIVFFSLCLFLLPAVGQEIIDMRPSNLVIVPNVLLATDPSTFAIFPLLVRPDMEGRNIIHFDSVIGFRVDSPSFMMRPPDSETAEVTLIKSQDTGMFQFAELKFTELKIKKLGEK